MSNPDITTHPVFAALSPEARATIARNAPSAAEAVRDRAYAILTAQGVDPLAASATLWSAACETARSDMAVEAARLRR